jgi:putative spermidine/putrescine transport system permease protein
MGIACVYQPLKEGYRAWAAGLGVPMLDAAYEFIDWCLSGWAGAFLNRQGYYTAVLDTAKQQMSPDEWDFWMEGKPAKGEILSPTGEKIESAGAVRDGGSLGPHGAGQRVEHGHGRGPLYGPQMERVHRRVIPHPPSLARWSPLSRIAGERAERSEAGEGTAVAAIRQSSFIAYLQALPLAVVFLLFFVVPIALVVVVSFFGYETYQILIPAFTLDNYREVFSEAVTYSTYLITVKFCAIVWAITSVLGFFIAYFLAFQLRSRTSQTVLLLLCSMPFWTSIVIRMIAWIPLLGRNGLVNRSLLGIGVIDGPQEWLLYSEFAVILGYVHLYTLMMIVPIFSSMMRIDRSLIEAATDAGASTLQVLWTIILPLSKTGIAIGSIFVIAR